jgi:hypothetical protein
MSITSGLEGEKKARNVSRAPRRQSGPLASELWQWWKCVAGPCPNVQHYHHTEQPPGRPSTFFSLPLRFLFEVKSVLPLRKGKKKKQAMVQQWGHRCNDCIGHFHCRSHWKHVVKSPSFTNKWTKTASITKKRERKKKTDVFMVTQSICAGLESEPWFLALGPQHFAFPSLPLCKVS